MNNNTNNNNNLCDSFLVKICSTFHISSRKMNIINR